MMTADEGAPSPPADDEPSEDGIPSSPPSADATEATDAAEKDERRDPDSSNGPDSRRPASGAHADESTPSSGVGGTAPPSMSDEPRAPDPVPSDDDRSLRARFWHAQGGPLFFLREIATSAAAVILVGLVLFSISGVWPPMVAVESGSMEPHMHRGDLVFITEPGRYTPDVAYGSTGVVTAEAGAEAGYRTFGGPGSVVVYDDPERGGPPVIHRAVFYVEAGENWYDRADPEFVAAESCDELLNCPAPHAGFITKGDANSRYDQASNIAEPVKPSWVTGVARLRIPYLGWVRLGLAGVMQPQPSTLGTVGIVDLGGGGDVVEDRRDEVSATAAGPAEAEFESPAVPATAQPAAPDGRWVAPGWARPR